MTRVAGGSRIALVLVWLIGASVLTARAAAVPASSTTPPGPVAPGDSAEATSAPDPAPQQNPAADPSRIDDLLNLDIEKLSQVSVGGQSKQTNLTAPSSRLTGAEAETARPPRPPNC